MMVLSLLIWLSAIQAAADTPEKAPQVNRTPVKSAYFAFVDRDFIFTIEVVKPGIPLLNFISMTDRDAKLQAKNIRLTLENRKIAAKVFAVETGGLSQPIPTAVLTIRPRSYFGVRLSGDFEPFREILGATIRMGSEELSWPPFQTMISRSWHPKSAR